LPFERHVYRVIAAVTLVRPEDDGDFHLMLRHGPLHMIAEAPMLQRTSHARHFRQQRMAAARAHVRVCARAAFTGVAFFDFKHGQTGVARTERDRAAPDPQVPVSERIASPLVCAECGRDDRATSPAGHYGSTSTTSSTTFCPDCDGQEFGNS
jgi:hypothetical protein